MTRTFLHKLISRFFVPSTTNKPLQGRKLGLESLEIRQLLSVTPLHYPLESEIEEICPTRDHCSVSSNPNLEDAGRSTEQGIPTFDQDDFDFLPNLNTWEEPTETSDNLSNISNVTYSNSLENNVTTSSYACAGNDFGCGGGYGYGCGGDNGCGCGGDYGCGCGGDNGCGCGGDYGCGCGGDNGCGCGGDYGCGCGGDNGYGCGGDYGCGCGAATPEAGTTKSTTTPLWATS